MRHKPPHLRHPRYRHQIPHTPRHPQIPIQRIIPRPRIHPIRQILTYLQLKPCCFHGGDSFGDGHHVGDPVALFDTEADFAVVGVAAGVGGCHEPFVDGEDAAGFEDAVDLGVDAFEGGGVDGGFDGVDGVEGGGGEGHLLQ